MGDATKQPCADGVVSFLQQRGAHALKILGMLPETASSGYSVHVTRGGGGGDGTSTSTSVVAVLLLKEARPAHFDVSLVAASEQEAERVIVAALGGAGVGATTVCFGALDRTLLAALGRAAAQLGYRQTWREACRTWTCAEDGAAVAREAAAGCRPGGALPTAAATPAAAAAAAGAGAGAGADGGGGSPEHHGREQQARLVWLDGAAHAETVNEHWKYKSGTSLGVVRAMLAADQRQCPCVGVEVAVGAGRGGGAAAGSTEAADAWELVSWCCTYPYRAHGMLGTAEAHQRRGFARACAAAVTVLLLDTGSVPFTFIVDGNEASERLFAQLGFAPAPGHADWVGWARAEAGVVGE